MGNFAGLSLAHPLLKLYRRNEPFSNNEHSGGIVMSKLKVLFCFMLAISLIAGLAVPLCRAAAKESSQTSIKGLRLSVKGNRTCLIFDAEGAKPSQIGPASSDGISVFFSQMTAKIPDKIVENRKAAAREVKYRRESGFFEVLFREKNVYVTSAIREGGKGRYTLTLELTPSGKSAARTGTPDPNSLRAEKPAEKVSSLALTKVETTELFGAKLSQQTKGAAINSRSPKADEPSRPAEPASKPQAFTETDPNAGTLYASANDKFESCSRNLVFCAPEIIEAYNEALNACPRSSQAPLAVYRMALAHSIMGGYPKADRLFRQVTSEWPDNPIAARCWIGIGDIYNRKQSYLEAMEAFRSAQRSAVEAEDKAAAFYELGKVFLILGANRESLEMLNNCIGLAPDYYTKKPDVFRFIGEALFGLGDSEKAKEYLLRFINCQQSAPDQDIVLAKLSETFLIQGDLSATRKLYAFVQKYYTDSEGDLICRIRQGELTEDTDRAIKIYNDLCVKDLSPSLRRIVLMKLAVLNLKRHDPAQSLKMLDEAFPARSDGDSSSEQSTLREKVLCELVRQYFSDKDFTGIIQLHEKYRPVFDSLQTPGVLEQIAQSYASLNFYSDALSIYDKLFAKGQKKEEDLLRCALYALRTNDSGRSFQFCRLVQSGAMEMKKSEILGHIFYRDQKYAEALKSFGKVLQKCKEFDLDDPDSWIAYGNSFYQAKKFDEAIPAFQNAMQRLKGGDADARLSVLEKLAKCFVEQNQYPKAVEMMEAAKQSAGEDRKNELLYDLSKLYIASGQPDKAIENLNQLKSTEQPFWAAIAEQQLNTIDMGRTNATP